MCGLLAKSMHSSGHVVSVCELECPRLPPLLRFFPLTVHALSIFGLQAGLSLMSPI
jgi:hypothetical protein